ncbi:unnamed protein product [Soboliphyme baturini]|uniref:DUF4368 domain-containing protein n=1 Tax=Soboliphyme baturini TaxID=241478 RepID=A0A183IT88_9BILA|nr:unnamed protein product [Soboliphyme baturini]
MYTDRYNKLLNRVMKGIPRSARKELRMNLAFPMIGSRNSPDIEVIDRVDRTAVIIDVTILFENGRDEFDAGKQ